MKKLKVHPLADRFPMMEEPELASLASDIAENGLIHPIILDDDSQIVDGRNRYAACELAKVEPRFEKLDGRDPVAFIVSSNLARRHLTKGQQAMAYAIGYPEGDKGGRGKKRSETEQFSRPRLSVARAVLREAPDLAEQVMQGTVSLDQALEKLQEREVLQKSTEAKFAQLRKSAPDLADRAEEGKLSLDEAVAILRERENREAGVRQEGRQAVGRLIEFASWVVSILSAMELGESITISAETWEIIDGAYRNLDQKFRKDKKP